MDRNCQFGSNVKQLKIDKHSDMLAVSGQQYIFILLLYVQFSNMRVLRGTTASLMSKAARQNLFRNVHRRLYSVIHGLTMTNCALIIESLHYTTVEQNYADRFLISLSSIRTVAFITSYLLLVLVLSTNLDHTHHIPQTAKTTRFQNSFIIYALNNYQT